MKKKKTNIKIDTNACKNKVNTNKNRMNGVMMSTNGEDWKCICKLVVFEFEEHYFS